jgi:aspartate aminotransferase
MFDPAEAADDRRDLVRLEVGESDFDTPAHVVEAANRAASDGHTNYTANAGLPELRAAVAATLADECGVEPDPAEVVVTAGGIETLHLAMLCTVTPGSEVVIPSPAWPNYFTQARLADADSVEIPFPFDLAADRVIEAMVPATDAVVLCTPSNPTGRLFDPDPIRAVVEAAADYDASVVADKVYPALTHDRDPTGIAALPGHSEHVLAAGSRSKSHATTGWLAGDRAITDEASKIRESTTSCTSSVFQHAAIAALTGTQRPGAAMQEAFRGRRDYVGERIVGVAAPRPEGAFYAFLAPETDEASLPLAKRLLREEGVVLAPGSGFGAAGEGYLWLSFASSLDPLAEGFDRLEGAF